MLPDNVKKYCLSFPRLQETSIYEAGRAVIARAYDLSADCEIWTDRQGVFFGNTKISGIRILSKKIEIKYGKEAARFMNERIAISGVLASRFHRYSTFEASETIKDNETDKLIWICDDWVTVENSLSDYCRKQLTEKWDENLIKHARFMAELEPLIYKQARQNIETFIGRNYTLGSLPCPLPPDA